MCHPYTARELPQGRAQASSFQEVEVREHVALLPSYLGKVAEGVSELLCSRVLLYHTLYRGVLLTFSHVRVLQRLAVRCRGKYAFGVRKNHDVGRILDELPHIHFDILYSATVFRPQVGELMCGHVNRVGVDHIGCLLYNCFNASVVCTAANPYRGDVQDDRVREGASRLSKFQKKTLRSWCSRTFDEGEIVWFTVTAVETTGSILSLRGEYVAVDVGGHGGGEGKGQVTVENMGGEEGGREEGGGRVGGEEEGGGEEGGETDITVNGWVGSVTSDEVLDRRKKSVVKKSLHEGPQRKKCRKRKRASGVEMNSDSSNKAAEKKSCV